MQNHCHVNKNHQFFFCSVHLFKKRSHFQPFLFLPHGEISIINFNWPIVIQEGFLLFYFLSNSSPLLVFLFSSLSLFFCVFLSTCMAWKHTRWHTHAHPHRHINFQSSTLCVMGLVTVWELTPSYGPEDRLI